MAINAKKYNPVRHAARRTWCGAIVVAAVLAPIVSSANAETSGLMANPGGSVSIEAPASTVVDQSSAEHIPVEASIGPPAEAPVDVAEALEIESDDAQPASEPAPAETSETTETSETAEESRASKPLGTAPGSIVTESETTATTDTTGGGWGLRTVLALAAVIGLILLCKAAFMRFALRGGGGSLASQLGPAGRAPSGLLSVLARYPVAKGSTLVLLRLDRRVLLLSQTGQGFTTLAEIDDPEEVAAIIMRAEDEEGASLTRRFRTLLTQAEHDPDLVGQREFEIEPVVPMTPRAATARFTELAMDLREDSDLDSDDHDDHDVHADAVGSLRNRLRTMREVTA